MHLKPTMLRACLQCGTEFHARLDKVQAGLAKYCGRSCYANSERTGQRFIARTCEQCGTSFETRPVEVRQGYGRFCGRACANLSLASHGETRGEKPSAEYSAWRSMRGRCFNSRNPAYHHYGGRGITVFPEWRASFETFLRDMGRRPSPQHSLDRIDNDGNYEPGNLRWAVKQQQMRNTRVTRMLTVDGVTRPLKEWAELTGISFATLYARVDRGWPAERVVSRAGARAAESSDA